MPSSVTWKKARREVQSSDCNFRTQNGLYMPVCMYIMIVFLQFQIKTHLGTASSVDTFEFRAHLQRLEAGVRHLGTVGNDEASEFAVQL